MTPEGVATADGRRKFGLLIVATVAAAIWLSSLAVLALRTANPVTVNRGQLLASDAVVIATPQPARGPSRVVSLRVERVLAGGGLPATLQVGGTEPQRFSRPGRYLVPLQESGEGFAIMPAPPALNGARLVYPATDETVQTAEAILATGAATPYE